jgi:hypothetical protein
MDGTQLIHMQSLEYFGDLRVFLHMKYYYRIHIEKFSSSIWLYDYMIRPVTLNSNNTLVGKFELSSRISYINTVKYTCVFYIVFSRQAAFSLKYILHESVDWKFCEIVFTFKYTNSYKSLNSSILSHKIYTLRLNLVKSSLPSNIPICINL